MRFALAAAFAALCATVAAPGADASRFVRYGVHDDAWLRHGPGTLEQRLDELDALGVELVRYTLRWDEIAAKRPATPRSHQDSAYAWVEPDRVLAGLRDRGIGAVVTIWGVPAWANGGRGPRVAPGSARAMGDFAFAAASRYPGVTLWTVWNEPNQLRWLSPSSPRVYVRKLLNPAYVSIHAANPRAKVGGGVTAPRGNRGGMSPIAWIRGMAEAGARLDAYAHHPYPTRPGVETPWSGGCSHCETVSMADLDRLIGEVTRAFGPKRIWLTEYGYQSNPPDTWLGVSPALQALYHAAAALRAYQARRVDMLIHFMVQDDGLGGGWQSGLRWSSGVAKPAYDAFRLPLAQVARTGGAVTVWGQVRPRTGKQLYRLQQLRGGTWRWVAGTRSTDWRGLFTRTVRAAPGSKLRFWSPRDASFGVVLTVR